MSNRDPFAVSAESRDRWLNPHEGPEALFDEDAYLTGVLEVIEEWDGSSDMRAALEGLEQDRIRDGGEDNGSTTVQELIAALKTVERLIAERRS
jgi:hypothetical protein